jgi:RNA polymerase sigma-70 factor (ECF subfamily)
MASLDTFMQWRSRLLSIAYRMLGTRADADDAVQEAWLRWQTLDEASVESPKAWLSTVVSRICLDRLKSARATRESYRGPWLPEPVTTDAPIDRESISLAFMVLLERLSPTERAAYLLHQVFDYSHAEVACMLGISEVSARQACHRAKSHLAENRPRFAPREEDHARILLAFGEAVMRGDLDSLARLLAEDVTLYADSDGKVSGAARKPVLGAERVAKFFVGLAQKSEPAIFGVERINGWPALVARARERVIGVVNIETDGARIFSIRNVVNPEKLGLGVVN